MSPPAQAGFLCFLHAPGCCVIKHRYVTSVTASNPNSGYNPFIHAEVQKEESGNRFLHVEVQKDMISTTSEYALRALVYLSKAPEDSAVLGRELARATDIPANYLSKILLNLRNAGYVSTARGSGGGYKLNSKPEDIFLIDVVELFEGSKAKPVCFLSRVKSCGEEEACSAHKAWRELSMAYRGFLVSTTVSMIAGPAKSKTNGEVDFTRDKPNAALAALAALAH